MAKISSMNKLINFEKPYNILVLIAGTTDPINSTTTPSSEANSYGITTQELAKTNGIKEYSLIPINYWDKEFANAVEKFDFKKKNLEVYPFHGWTGDNSIKNREIAARFLIDELCGNGYKSKYENQKNEEMTFHFLGHSHGGNVINEATKYIAELSQKNIWPKKWKIKSLIYLSTPFFKNIHQVKVDESFFHKDAEVFNMYNKYDLTQRMLADFSLEQMLKVLLLNNDFKKIENIMQDLKTLHKIEDSEDIQVSDEEISTVRKVLSYHPTIMLYNSLGNFVNFTKSIKASKNDYFPFTRIANKNDKWYDVLNYKLAASNKNGEYFYTLWRDTFTLIVELLKTFTDIIDFLSENTDFKVSKTLQNKVHNELDYQRVIIPENATKSLKRIIETIQKDYLSSFINSFQERIDLNSKNSSNYYFDDFLNDFNINDLSKYIIQIFDIDIETLTSKKDISIWNIIYEILNHNIEQFDNTYVNPEKQFENSFLYSKINSFDITSKDEYDNAKESKNFDKFIEYIERVEFNCEKELNQTNLLDLLFTLIRNFGVRFNFYGIGVHHILFTILYQIKDKKKIFLIFEELEIEKRLAELISTFSKLNKILDKRYFGELIDKKHKLTKEQLENNRDKNPYNNTLQRGSLEYFLIESHSTSRRVFHKELEEFLEKVIQR